MEQNLEEPEAGIDVYYVPYRDLSARNAGEPKTDCRAQGQSLFAGTSSSGPGTVSEKPPRFRRAKSIPNWGPPDGRRLTRSEHQKMLDLLALWVEPLLSIIRVRSGVEFRFAERDVTGGDKLKFLLVRFPFGPEHILRLMCHLGVYERIPVVGKRAVSPDSKAGPSKRKFEDTGQDPRLEPAASSVSASTPVPAGTDDQQVQSSNIPPLAPVGDIQSSRPTPGSQSVGARVPGAPDSVQSPGPAESSKEIPSDATQLIETFCECLALKLRKVPPSRLWVCMENLERMVMNERFVQPEDLKVPIGRPLNFRFRARGNPRDAR